MNKQGLDKNRDDGPVPWQRVKRELSGESGGKGLL